MARTFFHTTNLADEAETEVTVEYTATAGCAAQTYGPPENCYPAEPPEVEIIDCFTSGKDGEEGVKVELSDADRERIETWLLENHEEDDDPEDWDFE